MPLLDPLKWNRALNDIERNTKKLADLTAGTTAAIGGVRIPREQRKMERDLSRLIQILERSARDSRMSDQRAMFRQTRQLGEFSTWRARMSGASFSPVGGGYFRRPPGAAVTGGRGGGGGILPLTKFGIGGLSIFEAARFLSSPFSAIAGLENKALSASRPYMNLRLGAFALGRAGGFSGQSLQDILYPGAGKPLPAWMRNLNVGPSGALGMLSNYGVAPTSAAHAQRLAQSLGYYENVAPGFAGLAPGSATGAGSQAAALGIVGAGETPSRYLGVVGQVLERAVAQGMDRARILSSIQDSLAAIEKSGALGISGGGALDLFTRIMAGGAPGARTGALQAQAIGGIEGTLQNIANVSPAMMAVYSTFNKTPPTSPAALGKVLGLSPDQMREQMKNPSFAATANNIISDWKAGRAGPAAMLMGQLMKATPGAFANMAVNYVKNIAGVKGTGEQALALQSFGMPYAAGLSLLLPGGGTLGAGTSPRAYAAQMATAQGLGHGGFDANADYEEELRRAGCPPGLISAFIAAGRKYDLDPVLLFSIAGHESSMNPAATNRNKNGSTDYGLMQVNSGSTALSAKALMDPATNIMEGARILAGKRAAMSAKGQTDIGAAIGAYNPGAAAAERAGVLNKYGEAIGTGVPRDVFGAAPSVEQQELAASSTRFQEFGAHLVDVNDGFARLTTTTESLIDAFGKLLMKAAPPAGSGTPAWSNPYPGAVPPF